MKAMLFVLVALGLSCGPPVNPGGCCTLTPIKRDFGYVGSYSTDGGATTQVQLIVSATGETRLSFVRNGDEVVQTFR